MDVVSFISTILGIVLAVLLFLFLPQYVVSLLTKAFPVLEGTVWKYLILGCVKLVIFLAYLGII
jgi:uncharacterized protein YqhQ